MTLDGIVKKLISKMERNVRPSAEDRRDIVRILEEYAKLKAASEKKKTAERKERAIAP